MAATGLLPAGKHVIVVQDLRVVRTPRRLSCESEMILY